MTLLRGLDRPVIYTRSVYIRGEVGGCGVGRLRLIDSDGLFIECSAAE